MPKFKLVTHATDINAVNGHHTVTVSLNEISDSGEITNGIPETFGIGIDELHQRFGGDIKKWRAAVIIPALRSRHVTRKSIDTELISWQDTEIDIE